MADEDESISAPLRPDAFAQVASIIRKNDTPASPTVVKRTYEVTVLLVGSDDSGRSELFRFAEKELNAHIIVYSPRIAPSRRTSSVRRNLETHVYESVVRFDHELPDRMLSVTMCNVSEGDIPRLQKIYPDASACIFLCNLASASSVEFMQNHASEVHDFLHDEMLRLQNIQDKALDDSYFSHHYPGRDTVASFRAESNEQPFDVHMLIGAFCPSPDAKRSLTYSRTKDTTRRFAFDSNMRWTEICADMTASTVNVVLSIAKDVTDDFQRLEAANVRQEELIRQKEQEKACTVL